MFEPGDEADAGLSAELSAIVMQLLVHMAQMFRSTSESKVKRNTSRGKDQARRMSNGQITRLLVACTKSDMSGGSELLM